MIHGVSNVAPPARASGARITSRRPSAGSAAVIAWSAVILFAVASAAQEPKLEVVLSGFEVTPAAPGPETLCRLVVTVENKGSSAVYSFGFDVELNGRSLLVYEKQLFLQVIEAGEADEVALYNFWTSESGRPVPADGKIEVVVRLREARWVEVTEVERTARRSRCGRRSVTWTACRRPSAGRSS